MPNLRLKTYFLNILAKKDYSEKELFSKAFLKGYEPDEIIEVLNYLKEQGFVNDRRLAQLLFHKYKNYRGQMWISRKFSERGLAKELLEDLLSQNQEESLDLSILKHKLSQKYKVDDFSEIDSKTQQKILAYLSRNGFTNPWEILKVWKNS